MFDIPLQYKNDFKRKDLVIYIEKFVQKKNKYKMTEENNHYLDEATTQEVVIAENLPMIQSGTESGVFNRFRKFSQRIGQNQWISEFDLFTTPLKLNYNGEDCYKTEFGGIVYLAIGLFSVIFSMMYQFPNGLSLQSPVSYYGLKKNNDGLVTVFDQTDTFFQIYLFNTVDARRANATQNNFFLKNVYLFQVENNKSQALNVSQDCSYGNFCFKKIPGNQKAYLNGSEGSNNIAYMQIEILSCSVMDEHPDLGTCYFILSNYAIILEITSFIQKTGYLQKTTQKIILDLGSLTMTSLDINIYTTNNNFFGYIANIFSYTLSYYVPVPQNFAKELKFLQTDIDCFDIISFTGTNACTGKALFYSGTTNIVTQNFDDITAPLLFFISISQTLFYLCYIFFLRNYSNNALHLRIADSVVYIPDGQGKHHNFKSGAAVFFACLIYNHNLVKLFDLILYVTIQRQIKKLLPIKVQLSMEMIAYGESCLGEQRFFNRINAVYEQQNLQPTKIIFDDPEEDKQSKNSQLSQKDFKQRGSVQSQKYFENQIDQEAFKRMCQEHEYYSGERKMHLCRLLKRNDKNFKLVLMVQELFEEYRRQVKQEFGGKEQTLPIYFNNEEVSGMSLYRSKP